MMQEGTIRKGCIVRIKTGGLYDGIIARVHDIEVTPQGLIARCDVPIIGEPVDWRFFSLDELELVEDRSRVMQYSEQYKQQLEREYQETVRLAGTDRVSLECAQEQHNVCPEMAVNGHMTCQCNCHFLDEGHWDDYGYFTDGIGEEHHVANMEPGNSDY